MKFAMGCTLAYEVRETTPFVFNIEAADLASQTILSETLTLDPPLDYERWTMPEMGSRYIRVAVPAGPFTIRYEAEVDLRPVLEAPEAVTEIAAAAIPLPTLVHLYPSRYCQSDKLGVWRTGPSATSRRAIGGSTPSATGSTTMSTISAASRTN